MIEGEEAVSARRSRSSLRVGISESFSMSNKPAYVGSVQFVCMYNPLRCLSGAPSTLLLRTAAVPTVVACALAVRRGAPRAVKAHLRADAVWRKLSGPTECEAAPAVPTLAIAPDDAVRLLKPDPSHTCSCLCLCLRRRSCCLLVEVTQLLLPHSESPYKKTPLSF